MSDHDPLCRGASRVFSRVTFDGTPFPCDCDLIAKVRADERAKARSLVAGLPVERRSPRGVALVERVRVLALIDGSSE